MSQVGLQFLLRGGSFLCVAMTEEDAHRTVQRWLSGDFKLRNELRIGGISPQGAWGVEVESIIGLHTCTIPNAKVEDPSPPKIPPGWGNINGSGLSGRN